MENATPTYTFRQTNFVLQLIQESQVKIFVLFILLEGNVLTLFKMGIFRDDSGWGGPFCLPKICHRYATIIKLGAVIPYLRKMSNIYESRDTPLEFYCY